jgi:hypothetical protein
MAAPVYRFLPWARRGLAQGIANPDSGAGNLPARTSIQVSLDVAGRPATSRVDVYGPGEVTGIDRRMILRTEPRPDATDFEPNYLAAIEFDPPDFPWLFTPAAQNAGQLRPWCVLAVIEKGPGVTVSVRADAPLPVLTIANPAVPSQELPDLTESWAWAHTQILEDGSGTGDLDAHPDANLSRLVCPRRLKAETRYLACVVPAFDLGVTRGLGGSVTGTQVAPAWRLTDSRLDGNGISLPLYYFWEFSTAVEDDIESMARRLHGPEHASADLGRRRIYAAAGHPDLSTPPLPAAARAVTMEGALRPVESSATPDPAQVPALTSRLAAIVARRDTPQLPAPLYGEWPAAQHRLAGAPAWMRELNTIVAHRIAAALGTEVVRRNQEAFVQAAWEQVGQVREANELAQRARLAAAVLDRMVARHFAPRPAGRLLQLAGPMLAGTSVAPAAAGTAMRSLAAQLDDASLPSGAVSPAYRRLASGQRQAVKLAVRKAGLSRRDGLIALTATDPTLVEPEPGPPDGVVDLRDLRRLRPTGTSGRVRLAPLGLSGETSDAEVAKLAPVRGPVGPLPTGNRQFFPPSELAAVISQATGRAAKIHRDLPPISRAPLPVTQLTAKAVFNQALAVAARATNRDTAAADFVSTDVAGLGARLITRLDAKANVARRIAAMVTGQGVTDPGGSGFDPYNGIQAFPVIGDSTYQYLDKLDGGWVLPEANGLEPDTAILLRTNPDFTSAFLVGLNHEMNSELLWRGYPTDQRGTPFQHFWDRLDGFPDIRPIHEWPPTLSLEVAGAPPQVTGPGEQIVLLLRGTLLRRYPDIVIYATTGTRSAPGATASELGQPMFFGQLRPDISLVGFPLTPAELAAAEWWFVLEQQLTAPRFGFDLGDPPSPAAQTWTDATWSMFDIDPGEHIRLNVGSTPTTIATKRIPAGGRGFGSTADQIAISLLQRPIRVSLHKDRLLLHPGGGS